jgi:hypothetical protein
MRSDRSYLPNTGVWYGDPSYNDDAAYDSQSNTLEAPISGLYQIDAGVDWAANGAGQRFMGIQVNGGCCYAGNWTGANCRHASQLR